MVRLTKINYLDATLFGSSYCMLDQFQNETTGRDFVTVRLSALIC